MSETNTSDLTAFLDSLSDPPADDGKAVAIILAAGHGKRIKSSQSKMLHEIWAVPTVTRVARAATKGLKSDKQVIVTGIMAREVASAMGPAPQRKFVLQRQQNGTGDAARVATDALAAYQHLEDILIFPGDMGLITPAVIGRFYQEYRNSKYGMLILTGLYEGDIAENAYGRIVRVPAQDRDGQSSGSDFEDVIEIKEHKDILALNDNQVYEVSYRGRIYGFTRQKLLEIREYNTGVYALKYDYLKKHIANISSDNAQGEYYITDLLLLFHEDQLNIGASVVTDNSTVIGFNNKSVLKEMQTIARERIWQQIKDIIYIDDKNDFFLAEEVVEQILQLDQKYRALDIRIGKGAWIGGGTRIRRGVQIGTGAVLSGKIVLGEGIEVGRNACLQSGARGEIHIGEKSQIGSNCQIEGSVAIGADCRFEKGVIVRGTAEHKTEIGNGVILSGFTRIVDCRVADRFRVDDSVLLNRNLQADVAPEASARRVSNVCPAPEGNQFITQR